MLEHDENLPAMDEKEVSVRTLRDDWTCIASRPRMAPGTAPLRWQPFPWAAIDLETAHRLRLEGAIIMASRHDSERVELVVRPAKGQGMLSRLHASLTF